MNTQLLLLVALLATFCTGCQAAGGSNGGGEKFQGWGTVTTLFALPQRQPDWPAGELTGSGFQPDPDEDGQSPGARAMLLSKDFKDAAALNARLQAGRRAWIKGAVFEQVIRIDEIEVLPFTRAGEIPMKMVKPAARFDLMEVGAWHNRMPPSNDTRHLTLMIRAENTAADRKPRTVKLERVFYSFDKDREGVLAEDMSLINPDTGMAGGKMEMTLPPGQAVDLGIRGEGVYPEGHIDEEIYVTVILSIDDERIILRGHTRIIAAV